MYIDYNPRNSTLQCLLHLTGFSSTVLTEISKLSSEGKKMPSVTNELAEVIKEMVTKGSALNLSTLKRVIGKSKPIFLGHAQQDAQ